MIDAAHRWVGYFSVIAFLLTGAYMKLRFPGAYEGDAGMRMTFRSAHVYILLSGLLNLLVGVHLRRRRVPWRRRLQAVGSSVLLACPALFTLAFFAEPARDRLDRPVVLSALVLALTGTLLHVVASREPEQG